MGKFLLWIVLGILAVVVFVVVFDYVKKEARPLASSPAELERLETGKLSPSDIVVITMDDDHYHRPGCPGIRGTTEKVTLRNARDQGLKPCPECLGENE